MGVRGRHVSAGEHHGKMGVLCKQLHTYQYYKIYEKCKASWENTSVMHKDETKLLLHGKTVIKVTVLFTPVNVQVVILYTFSLFVVVVGNFAKVQLAHLEFAKVYKYD